MWGLVCVPVLGVQAILGALVIAEFETSVAEELPDAVAVMTPSTSRLVGRDTCQS